MWGRVELVGLSGSRPRLRRRASAVLLGVALVATVLASPVNAQAGVLCGDERATIVGTSADDVIVGTDGADVIAGLGGNDQIVGLDGDDLICGDEGNDVIRAGRGEDTVLGGAGNDTIRGQQNADVILGGEGNDTIRGNNGADLIEGGSGDDTILGGKGMDELHGNEGADDIGGGNHDDLILGGAGDDFLRGGNAADTIHTGPGMDRIRGGIGVDRILTEGSLGNDINTGDGADFIDGLPEAQAPVAQAPVAPAPVAPAPSPSSGSFFHEDFGGETFTGEVFGILEVPRDQFSPDEEGTCYLVLGVITPGVVSGPVSSPFDTPTISAIAGGERVDSATSCDNDEVELRGYTWRLNASGVSGTDIAFYSELFVPDGLGSITDILVGNPFDLDEVTVIPPVVVTEIPSPGALDVGGLPTGAPVGENATFEHDEPFGDASWTGQVLDFVTAPTAGFIEERGSCFLVLGSLTPTAIEGVLSSGFDTPQIGVLVNGQYFDDGTECDTSAVEAQGFGWILNAEVTVGTEYLFYSEIFVPEVFASDPSHVIVGRPADDADVFAITN